MGTASSSASTELWLGCHRILIEALALCRRKLGIVVLSIPGPCVEAYPAKRAMAAQISLAVSGSTSRVDGIRVALPYAPMIAAASLESMHGTHLVKRTVWLRLTCAVVIILGHPFGTWSLHFLHRAREVGAIPM